MTIVHVPPQVREQCSPDELVFIERRLRELSAKELLVLGGALNLSPANTPTDFINRSYQLEDYHLCLGASDYRTLGVFSRYYLGGNGMDGRSDTERGVEIANNWPDGLFLEGSYVYRCGDDAPEPYDGQSIGSLTDHFYSVKLRLASPDNRRFCSLRLPDMSAALGMPDEVEAAKAALDVRSLSECRLVDAKCILPDVGSLLREYEGRMDMLIEDGNSLGWLLRGDENALARLTAAMDYEECYTLGGALDIADHLGDYAFLWQQAPTPEPEMELQ
ncbi:hypothetical protein LJC34_06945 [Oscillospiraceae bacterium OttesenSCG-928-G22]|nr:hypothetical protein [Oscillospiraceae bacterium OttesenSCG-928-G22]